MSEHALQARRGGPGALPAEVEQPLVDRSLRDLIVEAAADPQGRALLRQILVEQPKLLQETLASIEHKGLLQRIVGDPGRILPPARRHPPAEPPFDDVRYSNLGLQRLVKNYAFETVLDVGAGAGKHAKLFRKLGKDVTKLDFGTSIYARRGVQDDIKFIVGDANRMEIDDKFDCVWASHVLEHQPNVNNFLRRLSIWCKPGGVIAITVPPAKFNLVGGHLTLWTPGLLVYNLVFSGIDCSDAELMFYGYNITVIARNRRIKLPELQYDSGDVKRLRQHMPPFIREGADGFSVVP